MDKTHKHHYTQCPSCGMNVSFEDDTCCACQINLSEIYQEELYNQSVQKTSSSIKSKVYQKGKHKHLIWKILAFIVVFHIVVFLNVYYGKVFNKVDSPAKPYMVVATTINTLYIFPLAHVFGYDNIIIKPLYSLRDYFYDKGINTLDKDDGEREIWWFLIRYPIFSDFVRPSSFKFSNFTFRGEKPTEEKLKKILIWVEEVENHIPSLATLPIKNDYLRSRRYSIFIGVIDNYILCRFATITILGELKGIKNNFDCNPVEINKLEQLLNLLIHQIEYTKQHEPEGYNYFKNQTLRFYEDEIVKHLLTHKILIYKVNQNKPFDCNDRLIKIFGESREKLRDYIYDPRTPVYNKQRISIESVGTGPDEKKIFNLCPNSPYLRLLKKDIDFHEKKIIKNEKDFVPPRLD